MGDFNEMLLIISITLFATPIFIIKLSEKIIKQCNFE